MLAVFDKTVAKCPEALQSPHLGSVSTVKDGSLAKHFESLHPGSVTVNLGSSAAIAYSLDKQNPLLPRLFSVVDDIFCLSQGHVDNVPALKQQYGLNKAANEAIIFIEAYRTLRDRGPYPADQVVRDFQGKFAFILYDNSLKSTFVASDADGSVPFFWGTDSEGHLILSDNSQIVQEGCGKSFAPFPKVIQIGISIICETRIELLNLPACVVCPRPVFTTSRGLRSFEHPLNELKSVPRVDSSGEICGATFKVDAETKKETGMPRVGSSYNWSTNY